MLQGENQYIAFSDWLFPKRNFEQCEANRCMMALLNIQGFSNGHFNGHLSSINSRVYMRYTL